MQDMVSIRQGVNSAKITISYVESILIRIIYRLIVIIDEMQSMVYFRNIKLMESFLLTRKRGELTICVGLLITRMEQHRYQPGF